MFFGLFYTITQKKEKNKNSESAFLFCQSIPFSFYYVFEKFKFYVKMLKLKNVVFKPETRYRKIQIPISERTR